MKIESDPNCVLREISARYGLGLEAETTLHGGEESVVTKARNSSGVFVIRVSSPWRTLEELTWAFELASFAATRIPEALAPVPARDGSLAFVHDGRVVSIFPFVEGAMLDRTSECERDSAAQLLARLHRVLPSWPAVRPRPASHEPGTYPRTPRVDPPGLDDPRLDARVAHIMREAPTMPAHGDFYRGNVRCVDGRITAVFDWDDARYVSLEYELAWSVWEFAQADGDATLDIGRAARFLDVYASSGGRVSLGDRSFVVPLIRQGLRTDVRNAAALAQLGVPYNPDYIARERAAFGQLADVEL